jgi:hypothetical protein
MANTVVEQEHGYQVDLLEIKVIKGNELTDLVTETMDGMDFAKNEYDSPMLVLGTAGTYTAKVKTPGAITGWEAGKEVRVSKQIAALGARGDYIDFKLHVTGLGTEAAAHLIDMFKVQALDYSGVPVAVQHSIFGKYSPFLTPTQPVSKGMIRGVDRQEIELAWNVIVADPETTFVSQKIRGTATSKLQVKADSSDVAAVTYFIVRAKPGGDGVFVIPRGAKIWAGNGRQATKVYTSAV